MCKHVRLKKGSCYILEDVGFRIADLTVGATNTCSYVGEC